MRILILDDDPWRHKLFSQKLWDPDIFCMHCYTANDAILQLDGCGPWDVVFLDHDLGEQQMVDSGPGTGYEVAQWLEQHKEKLPERVIVHSLNRVGAANIKRTLPFAELEPGWFAK